MPYFPYAFDFKMPARRAFEVERIVDGFQGVRRPIPLTPFPCRKEGTDRRSFVKTYLAYSSLIHRTHRSVQPVASPHFHPCGQAFEGQKDHWSSVEGEDLAHE